MTIEDIRSQLAKDKIDYILAQYVDIHGTPRCKGIPASALDLFVGGSAGFAGAAVWGMGQGPHDHDMSTAGRGRTAPARRCGPPASACAARAM